MKNYIYGLLLFVCGACAPTGFTRDLCLQECNECPIPNCDEICNRLETGMQSETCSAPSNEVWECAVAIGCDFPTECAPQISEFLLCEETE